MKILILEDNKERSKWFMKTFAGDELTFTKRAPQAISCLRGSTYDLIFLDRDLGFKNESGEDVALAMKEEKLALDSFIVIHSINPCGQRTMKKLLKDSHKVVLFPFTILVKLKREDFKIDCS